MEKNNENERMDDWLFSDEEESVEDASPEIGVWKVLIVDDEEAVHSVTKLSLAHLRYEGRRIEFFSAFSAAQAREILAAEAEIAVILLDVVMEEEDSGLRLARYIRYDLGNRMVRIILRTGQPGQAPEERVILEYDINDYK